MNKRTEQIKEVSALIGLFIIAIISAVFCFVGGWKWKDGKWVRKWHKEVK